MIQYKRYLFAEGFMNNNSLQNSAKRTFVLASVLCGVIFAFSSFIIKPLSIALSTDIMFTDSWIMYVLDALLVFCEVASYSIMFASIIYFVICLKNSPLKLIFLCLKKLNCFFNLFFFYIIKWFITF